MADSLDDINFDNLVQDIKEGKCVLFIGPDIVQVNGEPLNLAIRNYLKGKCKPDDIIQDYQRDGFFLFSNKVAKSDAQRYFNMFFDEHIIDDSIYKKILEIPFHLIISTSADTLLADTACKYGVEYNFSYFATGGNPIEDVLEPTSETPLFYNLCGRIGEDDSLLLDFDDLFKLLNSAMSNPGLPQNLKKELQIDARTFIFLGFQFDKWHTQLLIRLLQGTKGSIIHSNVLGNPVPDTETNTFLIKQFNIEFLPIGVDFFTKLYDFCNGRNILRNLEDPLDEDAFKIKKFVKNNKIDEALKIVSNFAEKMKNDNLENQAISLMNSYSRFKEAKKKKIFDINQESLELNRILAKILDFTKQGSES